MDELDFSKPAGKPAAPAAPPVSLAAALDFFRTAGVAESVDTGTNIFVEDEKSGLFSFGKSRKMYLLLEGEVNLIAANKLIGVVRAGEIFGEMAAISESPRAATAVAKVPCRLISMDDKGFHAALKAKPDFALTLLGMMINRLRGMLRAIFMEGVSLQLIALQANSAGSRRGQRQDLLEILDDRDGNRSTIITSQLPIDRWHDPATRTELGSREQHVAILWSDEYAEAPASCESCPWARHKCSEQHRNRAAHDEVGAIRP